jgi:heme/copper-type cytochrome/quinol oxidase subunit 2
MEMTVILLPVLVIVLWLNVKATLAVKHDAYSLKLQKVVQLLIIWVVPIIGSVIVLAIHRSDEKHPGKYREEAAPPDDYGSLGRTTRGISEAVDGD